MVVEPVYEIWSADLNSLYDDMPSPEVFMEDCFSLEDAISVMKTYQNHDTAAWIVDKNSRKIVKI